MARNTELQAIGRIYREGQAEQCYIIRLHLINSMDKYRENRSTKKFVAEMAVHSEGAECPRKLEELMRKEYPDEHLNLQNAEQLEEACRLLINHLFNLEEVSGQDGEDINLEYGLLKRSHEDFQQTWTQTAWKGSLAECVLLTGA